MSTGTIVKQWLEKAGLPACGNCDRLATRMDSQGIQWCEDNIESILDEMKANAKALGLPFIRAAARFLLNQAIRKAKSQLCKN